MVVRLVLGLALTLVVAVVAARRAWWLYTLISSGQPDAKRAEGLGGRVRAQFVEVFGQRKLLRWSIPGLAHLFTMWGFIILLTVYIEAYGALFVEDFHIPLIGRWAALGFLQDFIAIMVLISIIAFAIMRMQQAPERRARDLPLLRLPHRRRVADPLPDLQRRLDAVRLPRRVLRGRQPALRVRRLGLDRRRVPLHRAVAGRRCSCSRPSSCMLHIAVALIFLVVVLYSKHLHIFIAPINVSAKRMPKALGAAAAPRARGQADRLRGSARGGVLRPRQDRGLHLEGHARLRDLHRVRSLPEPVPGVEHRQAALAEAADHGPARPHVREGAVHDRRQGHARRGRRHPGRRGQRRRPRRPRRPGVGLRAPPRHRPPAGRPPAGRRPPSSSASSTPTSCGPAPPAARASSSARSTSSTSTTSSTCAATRS